MGPFHGKQNRLLRRLKKLLSHPQQRGRVVSISELCRKLGCTRFVFDQYAGKLQLAQTWLAVNQDAPLDAKSHYKWMLEEALSQEEQEVEVARTGTEHGKPVTYFVSRRDAQEKITRTSHSLRGAPEAQINRQYVTCKMQEISKKEAVIDRIRETFVMAPVGEMPEISKIMQGFGLLDQNGLPTGTLTETEVREAQARDEWKDQRRAHLHSTFDLLYEEVQMVSFMRDVEMDKILYTEFKVLHRMNMQYFHNGYATTLDGSKELAYQPNSLALATLAEARRRMKGGGNQTNILINQLNTTEKNGSLISPLQRKYLQMLTTMNLDDIEEETCRMETLAGLLSEHQECMNIEEIEAHNESLKVVDLRSPRC